MQDAVIVPLKQEHLVQVEKWPSRNTAVSTLLKSPVVPSAHQPDSYGWAALKGEEVLAIATVKLNQEHVGYLNCIVNPMKQRHGIGTALVDYVMKQPSIEKIIHLHAVIDPANIAAQQILDGQGFTKVGHDSNGYIEFARHKY